MNPKQNVANFLFPNDGMAYVIFFISCFVAALYVVDVGTIGIWPDTLYYADRGRHFWEEGRLAVTANYPDYLPLYSLFLSTAFLFPDVVIGHKILRAIQTLLLLSAFFPLRGLLRNRTSLKSWQVDAMAALALLMPYTLPYATMMTHEAVFTSLIVWFVFFFDRSLEEGKKNDVWLAGIFLALGLLTHYLGWMIWAGACLSLIGTKRLNIRLLPLLLLPLGAWVIWALYSWFFLNVFPIPLPLHFNNALARFNLIKNGILYVLYASVPLAGLGFLMSLFFKFKNWRQEPFFLFGILAIAGAILYAGFSTSIIVDKKLDFISNRALEPFLFLPLIIFFRLEEGARKELLSNGLLVLFVLLIFGMPYDLKADFSSGLSFWAQSLPQPGFGFVRNIIYLALLTLPVSLLYMRPHWFVPAMLIVTFLFVIQGLGQNRNNWKANEDSNFSFLNIQNIHRNPLLQKADGLYADYRCREGHNDMGGIFRCYDMAKILYFLPHLPKSVAVEDIQSALPDKEDAYIIYGTSENDNLLGPIVSQLGLAKLMKVTKKSLEAVEKTPLVEIKNIDGMDRYIFMPVQGRLQRMTVLDMDSVMHVESASTGCAEFAMQLLMDGSPETLQIKMGEKKTFRLIHATRGAKVIEPTTFMMDLPQGKSEIKLNYGDLKEGVPKGTLGMIMFDRPLIRPCNTTGWH
jgi:hypothetical protein